MTLALAIADAIGRLQAVSDSPRQDAEWLLAHLLGYSRAQLFTRLDHPLPQGDLDRFKALSRWPTSRAKKASGPSAWR